jgi:hypothetical protein
MLSSSLDAGGKKSAQTPVHICPLYLFTTTGTYTGRLLFSIRGDFNPAYPLPTLSVSSRFVHRKATDAGSATTERRAHHIEYVEGVFVLTIIDRYHRWILLNSTTNLPKSLLAAVVGRQGRHVIGLNSQAPVLL